MIEIFVPVSKGGYLVATVRGSEDVRVWEFSRRNEVSLGLCTKKLVAFDGYVEC